MSFIFFSKFIPRYFLLFHTMVNGIVFLISLSDLPLLEYRDATEFCVLILYPATLPNSLMSSSCFQVAFLECFYVYVHVTYKPWQFYFFLSKLDTFYFFYFSDCCGCVHACTQSLRCVQLFVTLWTVAYQSPLSMGFSRQEYWSGLPCPSPGDLPNPGVEPMSPVSLTLWADSSPTPPT